MGDGMRVDRIEPRDAQAVRAGCGLVRCKVCGHEWVTEPAEDALLAKLFEHDATHDEPVGGELQYKGRLTALAKDAQQRGEGDHADLGHDEP
jgi:hypothetical protein